MSNSSACTFSGRVSISTQSLFMQSSFVGATAIGDLIKSTLGPKGMVSGWGLMG